MAKNYMQDVARMLGVELGEEFKIGNFPILYKFTEQGLFFKDNKEWNYAYDTLDDLLRGDVEIEKLPWQPRKGDKYYRPSAYFKCVDVALWEGYSSDFALKEAGMIFRTAEECEAALPALRKKYLGGDDNV